MAQNSNKHWAGSPRGIALMLFAAAILVTLSGRGLAWRPGDRPLAAVEGGVTAGGAQPQQGTTLLQSPTSPILGEIKQEPGNDSQIPLTPKQRQELLKSKFEKMKHDADDLAALAKSLQQDVGKSSENVLSLKVLDRADKIEKLARRIKSEAKGD